MNATIPEFGPPFETMMREIDEQLTRDGIPIPNRPIHAVMAVGTRFKIPMTLGRPSASAPEHLRRHAQLSENISAWYESVYGDRLKIDFSPGKTVICIDGDLYLLSVPRILGSANFFASREFVNQTSHFSQGPAPCNILQLIQSLTPAKASALSERTIEDIANKFLAALNAHYILEVSQDSQLIQIARGDIQSAINNLMDRDERFGESKWASLQATEKLLKATIELEGAKFNRTHDLLSLGAQLEELGFVGPWRPLIDKIQCGAGTRYGEIKCTRDEALDAHHSSLQMVILLTSAGAKFKRGLG